MKKSIFALAAVVAIALASAGAQAHIAKSDDATRPSAAFCLASESAPLSSAALLAIDAQDASVTAPAVVLVRAEQYAFDLLARQRPEITPD